MGAGRYIVESMPGVALILVLGWAILQNHSDASVALEQSLLEPEAAEWESGADAALEVIGQFNVSFQDRLEVMLESASGQLCMTTSLRNGRKAGGSL